ncbi:MAG: NAD(P)-dependent oxidoreductase [Rhodocyclales bacterium]|nr:NAD(P)-dependent oxidoreductase [Rhodocyclales bacterium]
MKVGFIGLGAMGRPMALHLLEAGHELSVYARRAEAAQPLVDAGATRRATPAEVAAASEVVFTMVTTGADVEAVALGEGGILHGARAGTVLVDMGTIPPDTARRIAAKLAERGIEAIDAPVSGGEVGARNATLAIMAGGKAEVLARVRPLLEKLGKTLVHVGPSGAGQVAKACNQMIMVSCIEAVAEAMLLAQRSGADPEKVRLALSGGSAGSRVLEVFGAKMTARDFKAGVEARLHHKDFGILLNEAVSLGAPLPVAAQVWQQLNALMAQGRGREDTSVLLKVLERESQ